MKSEELKEEDFRAYEKAFHSVLRDGDSNSPHPLDMFNAGMDHAINTRSDPAERCMKSEEILKCSEEIMEYIFSQGDDGSYLQSDINDIIFKHAAPAERWDDTLLQENASLKEQLKIATKIVKHYEPDMDERRFLKQLSTEDYALYLEENGKDSSAERWETEVWFDISGYEGLYRISNEGRVYSFKGRKIITLTDNDGYYEVDLHKDGVKKRFKIHRLVGEHFIHGCNTDKLIDHKDGNGLNNKVSNLRYVSNSQNNQNSKKPNSKRSRFKGVGPIHNSVKWHARIAVNKKQIHIGTFETEEDAARAYDKKALECFGEFAKTNEMMGLFYE